MQNGPSRHGGARLPQALSRATLSRSGSNLWRQPAGHDIRTVCSEMDTVFSHLDAIDNEICELAFGTGEAVQIY